MRAAYRRWATRAWRLGCGCAGLGSLALVEAAWAQNAPGQTASDLSETNQAPQLPQTRLLDTAILAPAPVAAGAAQPVLQLGPVVFRPHMFYRFLYAEGLPAAASEKVNTSINELDPGIGLELGKHWHLDYTPVLRYYSSSLMQNETDQSVVLVGRTAYENWTFGLSQSYASISQPLLETGEQTSQETYSTALSASYAFNAKTSLEMAINQDFRFVGGGSSSEQLVDTRIWSTMEWLNYQFWPRFNLALGGGGGYVDLSAGSPSSFEQVQGRLTWRVAGKLSLAVSAGYEEWQFLEVNSSDLVSPLFAVSINYQPFKSTSIALSANRSAAVSFIYGEVVENTGVSGSIQQRLFKRLRLDVTTGYGVNSYEASAADLSTSREDHNVFVNARLGVQFLKRAVAGVFYQANRNTSTIAQFKVSTTQAGFDVGYSF